MKYFFYLLVLSIQSKYCSAQTVNDSVLINSEFKWSIVIPEGFIAVNQDTISKMVDRGTTLMENTTNQKVENNSTHIFFFKSNRFNYFESLSQPFDTLVDGNFIDANHQVGNILYNTFSSQLKNAEVDTSYSFEKIDGLDFLKFKLKIKYPNNFVFNFINYNRIFEKKEFTVNIMYVDDIKGALMLNAWKKSKFR